MDFQNQDLHTVTVSIDNETDTAINDLYQNDKLVNLPLATPTKTTVFMTCMNKETADSKAEQRITTHFSPAPSQQQYLSKTSNKKSIESLPIQEINTGVKSPSEVGKYIHKQMHSNTAVTSAIV